MAAIVDSSSERLAGKVAVITGAASGIGKATAVEFIKNGAKVILADVQDDAGRAIAAELGPHATYTHCDVTDEAQIAAAVDLAVELHGHLDILYNNAGISGSLAPVPMGSFDMANYDRVMALNARAVLAGVKHGARVMVPRKSGCILCTASVAGVITSGSVHSYSISKATVIGIVRSVAGELASSGVRVNCISPHAIATPFQTDGLGELMPGLSEEDRKRAIESLGEFHGAVLQVEDIANAAVYLASNEAKYVSGHNLVVDGTYSVVKHPNFSMQ